MTEARDRELLAAEQRALELEQQLDRVLRENSATIDSLKSTEQKLLREADERERLESELLRAQKLEAMGQLAAGIAHEINTPTQFIGDNTRFIAESFHGLLPVLRMAEELAREVCDGADARAAAQELSEAALQADLEFLCDEIPHALSQSLEGIERVRKIVQSMKEFAHPGGDGMTSIDLNRAVESTITVASNEWKYVADVETDLDPTLPAVSCIPGELNQVLLNLIVNAAHAIADARAEGAKGLIRLSTRLDGDQVEIRVADSGTGIPEEVRERIFDPFFTTKEVGKGTGQGLAMAYAVIVGKHAGSLDFETTLGEGTTFIIRLPLFADVEVDPDHDHAA